MFVIRRLNQAIAVLLALCVALAGMVGLSPDLHRLLEHGGQGSAHTHTHGDGGHTHAPAKAAEPQEHSHDDGVVHSHPRSHESLFVHAHGEFALPTAELAKLFRFFVHVLSGPASDDSNSDQSNGEHHHDSLTQLLAGGLVDLSPEFPPLTGGSAHLVFFLLPNGTQVPGRDWYAPTAERGPPPSLVRLPFIA